MWGMKFNNVKCVQMTITNKRKEIKNTYYLDKVPLEQKESIKYLGVIIDNKLNFEKHIKEKAKNATKILNLLRRNLYFAPRTVKKKAYVACVLPILEYASSCWSPNSEKMKNSLEMVHHNAAKFITNTYPKKKDYTNFSITKLLNELNFDTLEERRNQTRLTMAYKIINNHVILDPGMLPKFKTHRPLRQCKAAQVGMKNQLEEPQSRLKVTGTTFFYEVPKLWNQRVSPAQAEAVSVDSFKKYFSRK